MNKYFDGKKKEKNTEIPKTFLCEGFNNHNNWVYKMNC